MKRIALGSDNALLLRLEELDESKKKALPGGGTLYEPFENLSVEVSGPKAEAVLLSPFECGAEFADFHFVRDCLRSEAKAAEFLGDLAPRSVPEAADTREGLDYLETLRSEISDAQRLTEAARLAGFTGDFPDFEKKFVCPKAFLSSGLAVKYVKNRTFTAFVRFRGGERKVTALCGLTRGDPAEAPLQGGEVLFFDALFFAGEGDPAEAFAYTLLENDALAAFSRRIRPAHSPVPPHLAAALFWGIVGGAAAALLPLPSAAAFVPLALAILWSAARLVCMKLAVKR